MAFLTYEEIVAALRLGRRLGDCVPEDVEGAARAIVAKQTPYYHVAIFDEKGVVLDPTVEPEPIDCECTDWTMVGYSRKDYDPSWYDDNSSKMYGHHPACPKYRRP